jgi:hypothetical protein
MKRSDDYTKRHAKQIKKFNLKRHNRVSIAITTTTQEKILYSLCERAVHSLYREIAKAGFHPIRSTERTETTIAALHSQILFDIPQMWVLGLEQAQAKQTSH